MAKKKNRWFILAPNGKLWLDIFKARATGPNGAWDFVSWGEDKSVEKLKELGYKVVRGTVEIPEEVCE